MVVRRFSRLRVCKTQKRDLWNRIFRSSGCYIRIFKFFRRKRLFTTFGQSLRIRTDFRINKRLFFIFRRERNFVNCPSLLGRSFITYKRFQRISRTDTFLKGFPLRIYNSFYKNKKTRPNFYSRRESLLLRVFKKNLKIVPSSRLKSDYDYFLSKKRNFGVKKLVFKNNSGRFLSVSSNQSFCTGGGSPITFRVDSKKKISSALLFDNLAFGFLINTLRFKVFKKVCYSSAKGNYYRSTYDYFLLRTKKFSFGNRISKKEAKILNYYMTSFKFDRLKYLDYLISFGGKRTKLVPRWLFPINPKMKYGYNPHWGKFYVHTNRYGHRKFVFYNFIRDKKRDQRRLMKRFKKKSFPFNWFGQRKRGFFRLNRVGNFDRFRDLLSKRGIKRRRRKSFTKLALANKKNIKLFYNIMSEDSFKKIFKYYRVYSSNFLFRLIRSLESGLALILYRSGLFYSIRQLRQLIIHSHVHVNGKIVNEPNYLVCVGDIVTFSTKYTFFGNKSGRLSFLDRILLPASYLVVNYRLPAVILSEPLSFNNMPLQTFRVRASLLSRFYKV